MSMNIMNIRKVKRQTGKETTADTDTFGVYTLKHLDLNKKDVIIFVVVLYSCDVKTCIVHNKHSAKSYPFEFTDHHKTNFHTMIGSIINVKCTVKIIHL